MHFIKNQWEQIRKGGINVLPKKIWAILMVALALPIVGIMRLIRPLILIRVGWMPSLRIGHFATNTAMYLTRRQIYQLKSLDIFYYNYPVSNQQIKKMWDRKLITCPLARWWEKANKLLPGGEAHMITEQIDGKDPQGLYAQVAIPTGFTAEEERLGQESLRRLGIPEGAHYVCFNARSQVYVEKTFHNLDDGYHNFRNFDILTYVPAVMELLHRGYYVVRMGKLESVKFPINDPKFIDYSMIERTDFMDVYLGAKCHFFLGANTGLTSIPRLFKRPIAWVNYIPFGLVHSWDANSIFIPKKLWLKTERRFLTFPESLNSQIGQFLHNEEYLKLGIEPIDNTEEEIKDLALELEERLNGKWVNTEEDELMQQKIWSLYRVDNKYHGVIKARIGALFLRKNRELLGSLLQTH